MPDITLPEDIQQIIWKRVYSNNIVSNIIKQSHQINTRFQYIHCITMY